MSDKTYLMINVQQSMEEVRKKLNALRAEMEILVYHYRQLQREQERADLANSKKRTSKA